MIKFTTPNPTKLALAVVLAERAEQELATGNRCFSTVPMQRLATEADLEAAGYISLAEHARIVDELLNRHEASNG